MPEYSVAFLDAYHKRALSHFSDLRRPGFTGPFDFRSMGVIAPVWISEDRELRVFATVEDKPDGHAWLHVSFSRVDRTPSYEETCRVRHAFFPADAVVVQVFPPIREHVNIHENTLHLWQRLDDERLVPDLRIVESDGSVGV